MDLKKYFKPLIIPLIIQIALLVSILKFEERYLAYSYFLFYLIIILYFISIEYFSLEELKKNLNLSKKFWKPVLLTIIFFMIYFSIAIIIENIILSTEERTISFSVNNNLEYILLFISTIILSPIAEELLYRKAIISIKSKNLIYITSLISMFLYAIIHSMSLCGILIFMIISLAPTISYIKTKNIYIPIVAHFIINFLFRGLGFLLGISL